jgi:kojibiose phosphorylase
MTQHNPYSPADDPTWHLVVEGFDPALEPTIEAVMALVNGYSGTRAALEEGSEVSRPSTFIAGVFNLPDAPQAAELDEPITELVVAPDWSRIRIMVAGEELRIGHVELLSQRRVLDLRTGILEREWRVCDAAGRITHLRSLRFASLDNRHVLFQQVTLTPENYAEQITFEALADGNVANQNNTRNIEITGTRALPDGALLEARTRDGSYRMAFATHAALRTSADALLDGESIVDDQQIGMRWTWQAEPNKTVTMQKVVAAWTSREVDDPAGAAATLLQQLALTDDVALFRSHAEAWAARWQSSDVVISGAPATQQQVRWALYHLIGAANPADERASVGARSINGERYRGHVFWDNETFVWPFYLFTDPQTARALLMYRYHNLHGARHKAQAFGYRGALFPWESADTGEETCPTFMLSSGERVAVLTLTEEQHISSDIAYAVVQYRQATGDEQFFLDYGAEMLLEIARFWASRAMLEDDGCYHIRTVIGPDEYHEHVDDNAYTNVMAQWTLRQALHAATELESNYPARWHALSTQLDLRPDERENWQRVADGLVTGFDEQTRLFEQFAGYHQLEEIDLTGHDNSVATIDAKLGWGGMQKTKVLKQADVVMLLFLLWDSLPSDVFAPNFRYYEPKTTHDSSLSPSFHALVAARLGDLPMAERYLRQAATIDLDFTREGLAGAAGGVHIAALGGIWQALAFGFLGMHPTDDGLRFRPHIPAHWGALQMMIQWRGSQLRVTAQADGAVEILVESGNEVTLAVGDAAWQTVAPGGVFSA